MIISESCSSIHVVRKPRMCVDRIAFLFDEQQRSYRLLMTAVDDVIK